MLLFVHMDVTEMLPTGTGVVVVRRPLLRYYESELYKPVTPNALVPGTGIGSAFFETVFFHGLFSVLGGCVVKGAAMVISKRNRVKV
jgi:hypothetical protein